MKSKTTCFTIALALFFSALGAAAQGTAFTYQGQLLNNGTPVNGPIYLNFTLYGSSSGGSPVNGGGTHYPVGGPLVNVNNGLFTVTLDFGSNPNPFTGQTLWLEIDQSTSAGGAYAALGPRVQMTPTPYAIYAENAAGLANGTAMGAGSGNSISSGALDAFIGGGVGNNISSVGGEAFIGGGYYNTANGQYATVAGGRHNMATAPYATVGGGFYNTASGEMATVPGGQSNEATGYGSFAAGWNAQAINDQTFVWSDGSPFSSTGSGQFLIQAHSGVGINTASPQQNLSVNGGMNIDQADSNNGSLNNNNPSGPGVGLTFGSNSGEGIASQRTSGRDSLDFYTGFAQRMIILNNGNVGIGTINPASALQVNGTVTAKLLTLTGGADLAEPFPMSQGDIPKGSVVVIDEANPGHLKFSDQAYDARVAGVVSGANGINPGIQMQQQGLLEGGRDVALTGRVYVRADACNGPIKPGDLLTTSSTPGHAMRVTDHAKAKGAVLGKAMTGLSEGKGMVLVLVTLQ